MIIKTDPRLYPFILEPSFINLLNKLLSKNIASPNKGIIFNFKDHTYSPELGGFHPVEIAISADGTLQYVTDFSYIGTPPMAELAKELDFDFANNVFQQFGQEHELVMGQGLFHLYASNFVSYFEMGVYNVTNTTY